MRIPVVPGRGQGRPFVLCTPAGRPRPHILYANAVWLLSWLLRPHDDPRA